MLLYDNETQKIISLTYCSFKPIRNSIGTFKHYSQVSCKGSGIVRAYFGGEINDPSGSLVRKITEFINQNLLEEFLR